MTIRIHDTLIDAGNSQVIDESTEEIEYEKSDGLPEGMTRVIAHGSENLVFLAEPLTGRWMSVLRDGKTQHDERAPGIVNLKSDDSGFKLMYYVDEKETRIRKIVVTREREG